MVKASRQVEGIRLGDCCSSCEYLRDSLLVNGLDNYNFAK